MSANTQGDAKRVVALFDRSIAGPVASLFVSSAFAAPGMSSPFGQRPKSFTRQKQQFQGSGVRFITTRTEDAMDSVLPCAAERVLASMHRNQFADTARLSFQMDAPDGASGTGSGGGASKPAAAAASMP